MKKIGPFTITQLDRGAAVRYEQDYYAEMGLRAEPPIPYESLHIDQKRKLRAQLLQVLKAMV